MLLLFATGAEIAAICQYAVLAVTTSTMDKISNLSSPCLHWLDLFLDFRISTSLRFLAILLPFLDLSMKA